MGTGGSASGGSRIGAHSLAKASGVGSLDIKEVKETWSTKTGDTLVRVTGADGKKYYMNRESVDRMFSEAKNNRGRAGVEFSGRAKKTKDGKVIPGKTRGASSLRKEQVVDIYNKMYGTNFKSWGELSKNRRATAKARRQGNAAKIVLTSDQGAGKAVSKGGKKSIRNRTQKELRKEASQKAANNARRRGKKKKKS